MQSSLCVVIIELLSDNLDRIRVQCIGYRESQDKENMGMEWRQCW